MSERKGNGGAADEKPPEAPAATRTEPAPADAPEPTGLEAVETPPTREELEALRRERDELRDQLLRRRADFENYRRRVERDRLQAGQDAAAAIFMALIPALDNLDRALASPAAEGALREGVELIRREILAVMERHGVTAQDPAGQRFDPELHQALSHEVVAGVAEGTVVEVFRKAYFLKGRLLRPALVKVAKVADEPTGPDQKTEAIH